MKAFPSHEEIRHYRVDVTRRHFLGLMGVAGLTGAAFLGVGELLRFAFPNATQEAPQAFRIHVDPMSIEVDNPLQLTQQRVALCRDDRGLYAVQLICTHLGCTPNYASNVVNGTGVSVHVADEHAVRAPAEQIPNGWACPCHGSRYFIDSTNFYGPAPRPMDWVDVGFAPDGALVVDRGRLVVFRHAGDTTPPQWRLDLKTRKSNGLTYGV